MFKSERQFIEEVEFRPLDRQVFVLLTVHILIVHFPRLLCFKSCRTFNLIIDHPLSVNCMVHFAFMYRPLWLMTVHSNPFSEGDDRNQILKYYKNAYNNPSYLNNSYISLNFLDDLSRFEDVDIDLVHLVKNN